MSPIARFLKFVREERLDCDDVTYDALPDLQRLVEFIQGLEHGALCERKYGWKEECTCGLLDIRKLLED